MMKNFGYYRPCMVTVPGAEKPVPAIFHRWDRVTELKIPTCVEGQEPESTRVTKVVGLVEFLGGSVELVKPESVRFLDDLAQIIWEKTIGKHEGLHSRCCYIDEVATQGNKEGDPGDG